MSANGEQTFVDSPESPADILSRTCHGDRDANVLGGPRLKPIPPIGVTLVEIWDCHFEEPPVCEVLGVLLSPDLVVDPPPITRVLARWSQQ